MFNKLITEKLVNKYFLKMQYSEKSYWNGYSRNICVKIRTVPEIKLIITIKSFKALTWPSLPDILFTAEHFPKIKNIVQKWLSYHIILLIVQLFYHFEKSTNRTSTFTRFFSDFFYLRVGQKLLSTGHGWPTKNS